MNAAAARTLRVSSSALHSMEGIVMTLALAKNDDHIIRGMAFGICWSLTPAGTVAKETAVVAPRVLSINPFDGGYQLVSDSKRRRTCFGVRMVICLDDDDNCTALIIASKSTLNIRYHR